MSTIYSSLPNPFGDLGEIKEEFAKLFNFFNSDKIKKKVDYGYSAKQTVDELTSEIIKRQKDLRLFHFSGHSGVSGLQFTDAQFDDEHVINFFNTISEKSKIECVFLNGCENETIVNKLSNVPIVIGTKSKIEDKTASKFTTDFISALIEGENTYRQAYKIAAIAKDETPQILDHTSAERGIRIDDRKQPLNDYFMVINKAGAADRKFTFKRGTPNWTKYLLLFFIVVAVGVVYLFRESIFKRVGGYSCDRIVTEEGKCNFVIGDFATIPKMEDFNQWLYGNIRNAKIIQDYLHAINIETFDNVIYNNSVDQDSLPSYCNYDFNLTGSITSEGNGLRAEFNVFPYIAGAGSPGLFVYSVPSLGTLDTLITTLNEKNSQQFVLYEMCVSCALNRNMPAFQAALQDLAETFDTARGSAMYQRLQYSLAEVNLHYSDTAAAIRSLDKISRAVGNDIALMAMERKIELYLHSNDPLRVYQTQSDLVSAMQARVQDPEKYILSVDRKQYAEAENKVRMTRADLVLKHQDGVLREYKTVATQDLEYLQRIKFQNRDFSRSLRQLKGEHLTEGESQSAEGQFLFAGRVVTENGIGIPGALLTFRREQRKTDAEGRFDFGTFSAADMPRDQLHISCEGYQDQTIDVHETTIRSIILKPKPEAPPEKHRVYLQGVQISSTLYRKVLSSLKSAGHPLDATHSENFTTAPANFSKSSAVVFHTEGNRNRATSLARQMQEWTRQSFEVRFVQIQSTIAVRATMSREDITIQWRNAE